MPDFTASYTSPTNPAFTLLQPLPASRPDAAADKTAYLAALRHAVAALQDGINKELTARMDKDAAKSAASGASAASAATAAAAAAMGIDDVAEEEHYGEEVQEED